MVEIVRSFLNTINTIIILWLLSVKPRHGYEIMKEIERLTGVNSNPSAIYSFLHSLEEEGLILSKWIMEKKARRCYFLTAKGERLLNRLKSLLNKQLRVFTESLMYPSRSKRPSLDSS